MIVTFLTDFGLQDDFVGTCHGVIARIAPDARVIDITHGIEPQAVLQGALVLRNTVPYMPVGVHLAVVDPGVGSARRAVALRTRDGRHFVGPDNGLLLLAARDVAAAHELVNHRLEPVSRTFHARDIFSPAAAHLAAGLPIEELGPALDPATLVRVDVPSRPTVLMIDRFGNIATNIEELPAPGTRVEVSFALDRYYAVVAETFADAAPGELILYEDSYGMVTLAISNGSAARLTGASVGDELALA